MFFLPYVELSSRESCTLYHYLSSLILYSLCFAMAPPLGHGIKRKRSAYDAAFKLRVVLAAEESNNSTAGRKYDVSEKLIRDWRKAKDALMALPKTKKARRGKKAANPAIETVLLAWIMSQRQDGYAVTPLAVRVKALAVAKEEKLVHFKASFGWCRRFMRRHGLSLRARTKIAQKLPADIEHKVSSFHSYVIQQRRQLGVKLPIARIGNMDETPMCFDMPAARTIDNTGQKTVFIRSTGHERTHFTVVLTCMADGHKLNPMVIFKRKTLPKNEKFPSGVLVHVHPKGWMDEAGVKLWHEKVKLIL